MDSLTETFNRQAQANFYTIIFWVLLYLSIYEKHGQKRRKRILKLDREFNAKAMKQSRDRYRRQVAKCRAGLPSIRR